MHACMFMQIYKVNTDIIKLDKEFKVMHNEPNNTEDVRKVNSKSKILKSRLFIRFVMKRKK